MKSFFFRKEFTLLDRSESDLSKDDIDVDLEIGPDTSVELVEDEADKEDSLDDSEKRGERQR